MVVFYRISESTNPEHEKRRSWQVKLKNATKKKCIDNFLECFPTSHIRFYVDSITEETWGYLKSLEGERIEIVKISAGSDAKSFRCMLDGLTTFPSTPQTKVLFQEDDYLYLPGAEQAIEEALEFSDYVTGYLHPDKFILPAYGGNPFVEQQGVSEPTRVVKTSTRFWMMTNSTTNTFASRVGTLTEDMELWMKATEDLINTKDFATFLRLREKGRTLLMPIPTLSTHCLKGFEAPLIGTGIDSWESL